MSHYRCDQSRILNGARPQSWDLESGELGRVSHMFIEPELRHDQPRHTQPELYRSNTSYTTRDAITFSAGVGVIAALWIWVVV
jgi:hypothetical protein